MVLLIILLLLLSGCRDATTPLEFQRHDPSTPLPRRLTSSPFFDHLPAWSPSGDSLYYTTRGLAPFPRIPGLLLSVPVEGGTATPLLPRLQLADIRGSQSQAQAYDWLDAVEVSPDGNQIVYADLESVWPTNLCPPAEVVQCSPEGADASVPRLDQMVLRVRDLGSTRPVREEPSLQVRFQGRRPEMRNGFPIPGAWIIEYHPFQQLFTRERLRVFRPSWSPDGQRIVFSDGLALRTWNGTSSASEPIPGTAEGVMAAWSPGGDWIAFTRLEHGEALQTSCTHFLRSGTNLTAFCSQRREVFPVTGRWITLVRPDGSQVRRLWPGDSPAWTPDGEEIVFRRDGRLWRGPVDGSTDPEPVPGTEDSRDPAVSPDGNLLAFTKLDPAGTFDVWVMELPERQPR